MAETMFRYSVGDYVWFLEMVTTPDGIQHEYVLIARVVGLWADDRGTRFLYLDTDKAAHPSATINARRWIREADVGGENERDK